MPTGPKRRTKYKTVHVGVMGKFGRWVGRHWLLLSTVALAGAVALSTLIPGVGTAIAGPVLEFASYNIWATAGIAVGANVVNMIFGRKARRASRNKARFLHRQKQVEKKFAEMDKYKEEIAKREKQLEVLKSDPNANREKIKKLLKEIKRYDAKITKNYEWIGEQLQEKPPCGKVKGFFRRIGGLLGRQTMRYYADQYRTVRSGKPDELELEGNLSEQIFRFNMERRDLIEGTRMREEAYNPAIVGSRTEIAHRHGATDVEAWFTAHHARMGTIRGSVKAIDILDGDRHDMGEIAKDLYTGAVARGTFSMDDYFAYRSGATTVPVSFDHAKGAHTVERILTTRASSKGRSGTTTGVYTGDSSVLVKHFKNKNSKKAVTVPIVEGDPTEGLTELTDGVANPIVTTATPAPTVIDPTDRSRWSM